MFHRTQIVLNIFPDIFKIRFTLCCIISVTYFLPYTCHMDNEFSFDRSFLCQEINIIDNMFLIHMELSCRHIPQCIFHQRHISGYV